MANMVRKANAFEILNHRVMAVSCIVLSIQGFGFLYHIEPIGSFFGGFKSMRDWHNYLGIAFSVSLFFSIFFYLKEALTYDSDDIKWIAVAGGYLSKKAKVPPMGKINTGQKFYYLALLAFGIGITASGFVLWLMNGNKVYVMYSHLIHNYQLRRPDDRHPGSYVPGLSGQSRHLQDHGLRDRALLVGEEEEPEVDCRARIT